MTVAGFISLNDRTGLGYATDQWRLDLNVSSVDNIGWQEVDVNWGDGNSFHDDFGIFYSSGVATHPYIHTYMTAGTYHVVMSFYSALGGGTGVATYTVIVGGSYLRPGNSNMENAIDLGVLNYAPGSPTFALADTHGSPTLAVWYRFELPYNAKLYFNSYWGENQDNTLGLKYQLYRQDGTGLAGLQLVNDEFNNPSNIFQSRPMVFLASGLVTEGSDFGFESLSISGEYFLKISSSGGYRQNIELHAEPWPGYLNDPIVYYVDQPGYGGTASPAPLITADIQGTLIAAELVTESDSIGYMQVLLAHTDKDGVFFYDYADPWRGGFDWGTVDTEYEFPCLQTSPDGSWMAYEYTDGDVGAGSAVWFDGPRAGSAQRVRVFNNTTDFRSGSRISLIPFDLPWLIEGHHTTDADIKATPAHHQGRGTWFVPITTGTSFVDIKTYIAECDITGRLLNYWRVPVMFPGPGDFSLIDNYIVALPDDHDNVYAWIFDDGSPDFRNFSRFSLVDSTFTHVPNVDFDLSSIPNKLVRYQGEWCFASYGRFTDVGLRIIDRDGVVRLTEVLPGTTNFTSWGGTVGATTPSRGIGTGQDFSRVWASHFQPLRQPSGLSGHTQFGTELWFYDIPTAQWERVGNIFDNFTDTYGAGGGEIHYLDVYDASPALLIPGPVASNLGGSVGKQKVNFWRHRA